MSQLIAPDELLQVIYQQAELVKFHRAGRDADRLGLADQLQPADAAELGKFNDAILDLFPVLARQLRHMVKPSHAFALRALDLADGFAHLLSAFLPHLPAHLFASRSPAKYLASHRKMPCPARASRIF